MMSKIGIHPKYRQLFRKDFKWRYIFVIGGRASGKSFAISMAGCQKLSLRREVGLFSRYTMKSAYKSIIPEFEEKMELKGKAFKAQFDIQKTMIRHKLTNSVMYFSGLKTSSGQQTAAMKGIKDLSFWINDEAEEIADYDEFDVVDKTIRAKGKLNLIITVMNPSHVGHWAYTEFCSPDIRRDDTLVIHTSYLDNLNNLDEKYLAEIERTKRVNPARYDHIFMGKWRQQKEGILWNERSIAQGRVSEAPILEKIVVAVDPATTATMESDETGIVVAGASAGEAYILEDRSGRYSPDRWAAIVKELVEKYKAKYVVAEVNQGGDMVQSICAHVGVSVRVKKIHANKGKFLRAEPVYLLYEQKRVHHVKEFRKLEDQMIGFNPIENQESPDRVDALVYAVTDLIGSKRKSTLIM